MVNSRIYNNISSSIHIKVTFCAICVFIRYFSRDMKYLQCKITNKKGVKMNLPNPWVLGAKIGNKIHLQTSCPDSNDGHNCIAQ